MIFFYCQYSGIGQISLAAENINPTETELTVVMDSKIDPIDYEALYDSLISNQAAKDSLLSNKNELDKIELRNEYELKKKALENKLLSANIKRIERDRILLVLSLLLLSCLLIGSYFLWRQNKIFNRTLQNQVKEQTYSLKQMNIELVNKNEELKKFSHIASHDIKEPIRNIGSFVHLIRRKIPADISDSIKPYFSIIDQSCNQIYTLIEDVMQYSTLDNMTKIPIEEVSLNSILENIKMNLDTYLKEKNAKIVTSNLPSIISNNSLLFIVLKNVIENGLKYNKSENPTVNVSCRTNEFGHEIKVEDNGIGISNEDQKQIFNMFTRLHNRKEFEGSGLGLSIVESSLNKLGGVIHLESKLGSGSKFTIMLPDNKNQLKPSH